MNKKQLQWDTIGRVDMVQCKNCGMAKYAVHVLTSDFNFRTLANIRSRCCSQPDYDWYDGD